MHSVSGETFGLSGTSDSAESRGWRDAELSAGDESFRTVLTAKSALRSNSARCVRHVLTPMHLAQWRDYPLSGYALEVLPWDRI